MRICNITDMDRFKTRVWDKRKNTFLDENEFFIKSCGGLSFYDHEGRGEFDCNRYIKERCIVLK